MLSKFPQFKKILENASRKLSLTSKIIIFLYILVCVFWIYLIVVSRYSLVDGQTLDTLRHFTQIPLLILPLIAGMLGLRNAFNWGGVKSIMGRSSLALGLGFLAWSAGMIIWNYYLFFTEIEIPYPSIADFIFILSWPFWTYGIWQLSEVGGIKFALRKINKSFFIVPLSIILISVYLLVYVARGGIIYDNPLKLFFDLFYPLGDVVILTITASVYLLLRKHLGGVYKIPILILFFGFLLNYFSDFLFAYTTTKETYFNGHLVDFLYTVFFMIMTLGLIRFRIISKEILSENLTSPDFYPETNSSTNKLFNQILAEIIKCQTHLGGYSAWEQVEKVDNIIINDKTTFSVSITSDPKKAINQLVHNYQKLFGDLAVKVSKNATYNLIIKLSPEEVPESLR